MDRYSQLYDNIQQLNEQRKRENFKVFMDTIIKGLEKDLDKTYKDKSEDEYLTFVKRVKSEGFRIYRNSVGKHKVDM